MTLLDDLTALRERAYSFCEEMRGGKPYPELPTQWAGMYNQVLNIADWVREVRPLAEEDLHTLATATSERPRIEARKGLESIESTMRVQHSELNALAVRFRTVS